MTCPVCGGKNNVIGVVKEVDLIVRKRQCNECGHVFFTSELERTDSHSDFNRIIFDKRRNPNESTINSADSISD